MPEPRHLNTEQYHAIVEWFASLSGEELEYRKQLCESQLGHMGRQPEFRLRMKGTDNQHVVWRQLTEAQHRKKLCDQLS